MLTFSTVSVKRSSYNLAFQGLRALAMLGIFFYHCNHPALSAAAAWSVSFFFMISGYLTGQSAASKPYSYASVPTFHQSFSFAWSRIRKLYPLHLITLFLSFFTSNILSEMLRGGSKAMLFWGVNFGLNLTLTKSLYPAYYFSFNGVSWFLSSYAVLCLFTPYALFLFQLLLQNNKKKVLLFLSLALLAVGFLYPYLISRTTPGVEYWCYIMPLARLPEYLLAMLAGLMVPRLRRSASALQLSAVLFVLSFCFFVPLQEWQLRSMIWIIPNLMLFISFSCTDTLLAKLLQLRPLVWIGNLSPYLFLIHMVVITGFQNHLSPLIHQSSKEPVISLLLLLVSCLLSLFFIRSK